MTVSTLPQFVNGAKLSPRPARLSGLGRGLHGARPSPIVVRPDGGGRGPTKLSRMVAEALRYLGTVRNYAPATLDSDQASFDQFHQFLSAHGLPDDVQQFTGDNVQRFIASLAASPRFHGILGPQIEMTLRSRGSRKSPPTARDPTWFCAVGGRPIR